MSTQNQHASNAEQIISHEFDAPRELPLQIMNILSLTEQNGKTKMTLTGYPLNATEVEIDTFVAHKKQAEEGFAGTFDQLKEYLSSRQTAIK